MTEPTEPRRNPSDITRLLYKAVRELPEEEQAAVFEYFFELGIGGSSGPGRSSRHSSRCARQRAQQPANWARAPSSPRRRGAGPNQQVIPVRLSEESHRRLKQWCADHDFHMSVVVAGLIERFLDGWQEPGAAQPAAAPSARRLLASCRPPSAPRRRPRRSRRGMAASRAAALPARARSRSSSARAGHPSARRRMSRSARWSSLLSDASASGTSDTSSMRSRTSCRAP